MRSTKEERTRQEQIWAKIKDTKIGLLNINILNREILDTCFEKYTEKEVKKKYKKEEEFTHCICPLSDYDHTFMISNTKKVFYCKECATGGDIFSFVGHMKKISTNDALIYIVDKYALDKSYKP